MLSLSSCASWPPGCLLWRHVYLGLIPLQDSKWQDSLGFYLRPSELVFPVKAPIQYSLPPQEGTWLPAQRVYLVFLRAEDTTRISSLPQTFVLICYSCPHSLHSLFSNESSAHHAWGQWPPALSHLRDLKLLEYLTHTLRHPDVFNMRCILGTRILKDSS